MLQFLRDTSSVIRLAQHYCFSRALSNTYTTGLALLNWYLDCAAGIQIWDVIGTHSQTRKAGGALILKQNFRTHTAA